MDDPILFQAVGRNAWIRAYQDEHGRWWAQYCVEDDFGRADVSGEMIMNHAEIADRLFRIPESHASECSAILPAKYCAQGRLMAGDIGE